MKSGLFLGLFNGNGVVFLDGSVVVLWLVAFYGAVRRVDRRMAWLIGWALGLRLTTKLRDAMVLDSGGWGGCTSIPAKKKSKYLESLK